MGAAPPTSYRNKWNAEETTRATACRYLLASWMWLVVSCCHHELISAHVLCGPPTSLARSNLAPPALEAQAQEREKFPWIHHPAESNAAQRSAGRRRRRCWRIAEPVSAWKSS